MSNTTKSYVEQFLEIYTLEDIKRPCNGELFEASGENWSAWYGNGELIIAADGCDDNETETYCLDNYGQFDDVLVAC